MSCMLRRRFAAIPKRRIVIHMDVNRTIIQHDPAGGKTLYDIMNNNVASATYGASDVDGKWKAIHGPGDEVPLSPTQQQNWKQLKNYDDFVDSMFDKPPNMDELPIAERQKVWSEVTAKRRALKNVFTEVGQPGERYRSFYEKQLVAMTRPDGKTKWNIIPAFFKLVNFLAEEQWPFTLVFRTFGSDLPQIFEEWKQFARGEHDIKPSCDLIRKMGETTPKCGAVFQDREGMFLCWGPTASPPTPSADQMKNGALAYLHSLKHYDKSRKISYIELAEEIEKAVQESNQVVGLVDYYPWWAAHAERFHAGKVFPVSLSDEKGGTPFQVFFDDNICCGDPDGISIVDIRNVKDNTPVTSKTIQEMFMCAVKPIEAILNEEYFIEELVARMEKQNSQLLGGAKL